MKIILPKLVVGLALPVFILQALSAANAASQYMDYFTATPIVGSLSSNCWGAAQVGPRDQSNGLEDRTLTNWVYWDGGIIKDEQTGIYHMFAARWKQSDGHTGWMGDSHVVHATSINLYGSYADQGLCFTNNRGLGHNVNVLQLKAGDASGKKYAMTLSGGVPGSGRVYGADSLDGPWTYLGNLQLDLNGYSGHFSTSDNFRVILRPDGKYEAMTSRLALADNILDPYLAQTPRDFVNEVPGYPKNNMEDQLLFHSGSQYHVIYNNWSQKKAYFFSSSDGIHDWKLEPRYAYAPASNFVYYADGTVNHWTKMERPSVYIVNGHVAAMSFAAINVEKEQDKGNDQNGSKVIVVPFDGVALDRDLQAPATGQKP